MGFLFFNGFVLMGVEMGFLACFCTCKIVDVKKSYVYFLVYL